MNNWCLRICSELLILLLLQTWDIPAQINGNYVLRPDRKPTCQTPHSSGCGSRIPCSFFPFSFWWVSPPAICSLISSLFLLGDFNLHNLRNEIWTPASFFSFWKQNSLRTPLSKATWAHAVNQERESRQPEKNRKKKKWSKQEKGNLHKYPCGFLLQLLGQEDTPTRSPFLPSTCT